MADIQTSCAYCGVGCGIRIEESSASVPVPFKLKGEQTHPANLGHLCAKGERLLESLTPPNSLRYPKLRSGKVLDWDDASQLIADKFSETIAQHGKDSVAIYLSGQLLTEDYYIANKFAKGYLGTANVDTNSRLCMSSAVSAMVRAFGEDVVPGCYEDFEKAQVIVLIGANTAWTHPVLFQRMLSARKQFGTKIVVIDPVSTATAKQADIHLAIKPGKDELLFTGLLGYLADKNAINSDYIHSHTEGFDEAITVATGLSQNLYKLAISIGISYEELIDFYQLFIQFDKVMTASCQGVNQSTSGTDTTNAIINCHLALGQIGQEGSGFFSLTGQPNAMGGREVGGLATMSACHMGFSEQETSLLQSFWQSPIIATDKGLSAVDMFDALASGKIKAIWIMGTNPAVSLPNSSKVRQALLDCPFVVVSEVCSDSQTAMLADVLLPAQGWSEKCGTVTNSERTITRQRGFISAKGQSKADWWAVCEVAKKMGFSGFDFESAAQVFNEYAKLSAKVKHEYPQKQLDLTGLSSLSVEQYDALKPTQWPIAKQDDIGQQSTRVFSDGIFATQSGKAKFFTNVGLSLLEELAQVQDTSEHNAANTILLNSGRTRDQWHTMTRTGHISSLRASVPEPTVYINETALTDLALTEGGFAKIGHLEHDAFTLARVRLDDGLPSNMAFMSMHWSAPISLQHGVNQALNEQVDPVSKQPAFKCQAANIEPVTIPWQGVVFGVHEASSSNAMWQVAQQLTNDVCYHLGFETEQQAFAFKASEHCLKWTFVVKGQLLHIQCFSEKSTLIAIKILSDAEINIALEPLQLFINKPLDGQLIKQLHQQIKAGNSPLICTCTGVTEADISQEINAQFNQQVFEGVKQADFAKALDKLQSKLGCGRQCGSCQSEVTSCAKSSWQDALSFTSENEQVGDVA